MKSVIVNEDDYSLIQVTKETLGITEDKAVTFLIEIGLFNIIHYPCGNALQSYRKIDEILSDDKYSELLIKIKSTWNI